MQRIGANGRRIVFGIILPLVFFLILIALDQITKYVFKDLYYSKGNTQFLGEFLSFTYTFNQGAAYGIFAGKEWGQIFFKILTIFMRRSYVGLDRLYCELCAYNIICCLRVCI